MCRTIFTLLCITATPISAKMRLLQQFSRVLIPICNWGVPMVFQLWMLCESISCTNVHSCKLIVSVKRILLTFITHLAIFRRLFCRNLVLPCRFLKKEDFWIRRNVACFYKLQIFYIAVILYLLTIYTADVGYAGTDSKVDILLTGTKGDSGEIELEATDEIPDPFERGRYR